MTTKLFKMTQDDFNTIMDACKPAAAIALQCGMPRSPQENANAAWQALGDKMGFDHMTVQPAGPNMLYFQAEPKALAKGEAT